MAEDDDYLSDKFLLDLEAASSSAPKTYSQRRKEASKQSQLKNEKNKPKSRLQREWDARQEGLSKSLFQRAKEEAEQGIGQGSKALSIMMKMGFKPGQSLGKLDDDDDDDDDAEERPPPSSSPSADSDTKNKTLIIASKPKHTTVPLPINEEYKGKKGIGLGKRAPSPTSAEKAAKMAKVTEDSGRDAFRDRSRQVYDERRAEGRLQPLQRTCMTLDEKAGKSFNVLWLDPNDPESFPPGLIDALELHLPTLEMRPPSLQHDTLEARMRRQMRHDALQPLAESDNNDPSPKTTTIDEYDADTLQEAARFIHMNAQDRLDTIVSYLRDSYAYCFWCGTHYGDQNEMAAQCPGKEESAHD